MRREGLCPGCKRWRPSIGGGVFMCPFNGAFLAHEARGLRTLDENGQEVKL
jgi:hypothetical protein